MVTQQSEVKAAGMATVVELQTSFIAEIN